MAASAQKKFALENHGLCSALYALDEGAGREQFCFFLRTSNWTCTAGATTTDASPFAMGPDAAGRLSR